MFKIAKATRPKAIRPSFQTTPMAVGSTFSEYADLEKEIEKYQLEHATQFYKRDSRTIEAALRRAPNREFSKAIRYSELVYSCIHGGKKFISQSSGKRPNQQYVVAVSVIAIIM